MMKKKKVRQSQCITQKPKPPLDHAAKAFVTYSQQNQHIFFFFQAEDGLRDGHVTGVQTCALPISALFTLDRGMVGQRQGGAIHVVLELQFSFKQKSDGLVVRADEVVVGQAGTSFENRKPVESRVERDNLQRLLDSVRARIEATADSAGRHDSTSRR